MRTKWTYKIERVKFPLFSSVESKNKVIEEALNRRGLDGWELVHGLPSTDGVSMTFYLKRPS